MRVTVIARGGMLAALGLLVACGGGGGSPGSAPMPSPTPPPPPPQKTLFVATQPVGAVQATAFTTQPVVHVRSNGTTDSADNSTVVTAALVAGTGTAGAQLTGTTTATASAGVATFTNLGISLAGSNYQLRFTATGVTEVTSAGFAINAPPAPTVTFSIDSSQDVHPISRFIYGMNGWDPSGRPKNLTLSRSGGNRMTAYNWENNASNAGSDYMYQNDGYLGGGSTPGGAVLPTLQNAYDHNAAALITVPINGYVAADKNNDGDVRNSGSNYLQTRFRQEKLMQWTDTAVEVGQTYRYRVIAFTTDGYRSVPSAPVTIVHKKVAGQPPPEEGR